MTLLLILLGLSFLVVALILSRPKTRVKQSPSLAKNRFGGAAPYTDTSRTFVHKRLGDRRESL